MRGFVSVAGSFRSISLALLAGAILSGCTHAYPSGAAPAAAGPSQTRKIGDIPVPAASFTLDAKRLYTDGQLENLTLDASQNAIVLTDWRQVENDADGAGYPYQQDMLTGQTRIRKELVLDNPVVQEARLLVYHVTEEMWKTPSYEATSGIILNGHEMNVTLHEGWNSIPVDPAHLRQGVNQIVISTPTGAKPAIIPIADRQVAVDNAPWRRSDPPHSFKSTDGGKTWSTQLGKDGAPGEYMIRFQLRRFAPAGTCLSPVMDLVDIDRKQPIKAMATIQSVAARLNQQTPAGTAVSCSIRTGSSPVIEAGAWDNWRPLVDAQAFAPRGRYAQLKLTLQTSDPRKTPALAAVAFDVAADSPRAADLAQLNVEQYQSFPTIRSSIPFRYESLAHPVLKQLRKEYQLDAVTQSARSQFEKVVALNHWVCQQWNWHTPDDYPAWNAMEILKKMPNGKRRGGFCGHYAIVLTQCCQALGIQARYVFASLPGVVSGHEVVEFWSDEYGKWVLIDPNMDRYYLDRQTHIPMSAMEVHQAILRHYFQDSKISGLNNKARFDARGLDSFLQNGPIEVYGGHNAGIPSWFDARMSHLMWGYPRMMPGSDFLSRTHPMPKGHGYVMPWVWNGYYNWFDSQTPRQEGFPNFTDRLADFYWNLNQVDLTLEQTPDAAVLQVTADTFTPDLESLLVSVDGGAWKATPAAFAWSLHPGSNSLSVRTRNIAGVEGKPSIVKIVR